ncbi:hypothetical protein DXG01_011985 [Tephrocybe rancida]|nr:hypothetical protein DXG01_011985 [Tephrocybe rancida]
MDVLPLPDRKRHNLVRATPEQVNVLMAAFATSKMPTKNSLDALSETTGLTPKWITSWYARERAKVTAAATGRTRARKNAKKAMAMSVQEITAFKTEHSDSTPSEAMNLAEEQGTTKKPRKRRKGHPTPDPPLSPLNAPFVSAPLPPLPALRPPSQPIIQAQAQTADPESPTSSFILREMVPQIYRHTQSLTNSLSGAMGPVPTEAPRLLGLLPMRPTLAAASKATGPPGPASRTFGPVYNPNTLSDTAATPLLGQLFLWQGSVVPTHIASDNNNNDQQTAMRMTQESSNRVDKPHPPSASIARQNLTLRSDRHIRPLLPLNSPIWNTPQARALHQPLQAGLYSQGSDDGSFKENKPIYYHPTYVPQAPSKLRSSGPRTLPPLFASTDLTNLGAQRQTQPAAHSIPTSSATSTPTQPFIVQPIPEIFHMPLADQDHQAQVVDQPDVFFDPTMTPLKHLDVLAPFSAGSLSTDDILNLLLDERLATGDPFQAAMGVVFASQLGLNWDFT